MRDTLPVVSRVEKHGVLPDRTLHLVSRYHSWAETGVEMLIGWTIGAGGALVIVAAVLLVVYVLDRLGG